MTATAQAGRSSGAGRGPRRPVKASTGLTYTLLILGAALFALGARFEGDQ